MEAGAPAVGATRPSIPLAAWFAASMWAGVHLAEWAVWSRVAPVSVLLGTCATLLLLVAMLWWRARERPGGAACVLAAGVLVGAGVGILFWASARLDARQLASAAAGPFVCEVVSDPVKGEFGHSVIARIVDEPGRGSLVSVMLPADEAPPTMGRVIELRGRAQLDEARDEWARRRHRQGQAARIKPWRVTDRGDALSLRGLIAPFRRRLVRLVGRLDSPGGALMQGVVLGERSRLRGTALEEDFRTTGLSHLIAVSGTHISIVAALIGGLLSAMRTPMRRRLALGLALGAVYVLLTGAPTSSLRALVMTVCAALASFSGRRSDSVGGLAAAVVGLLAASPANAFDIGFALSVVAVGGLVLFAPLAEEWACAAATRRTRAVASALSLPVVAQLATMPVAVPAFNMVSVVGPLANALVLPLASLGLGMGVVGSVLGLLWAPAGMLVLRCTEPLFAVTIWIVERLAALPRAAIAVGGSAGIWGAACLSLGGVVWAWWPHPHGRRLARGLVVAFALAIGLFVVGIPIDGGARLQVLDVGQGDAILVADGASAVLVDTGPDPTTMRKAAARVGLRRLDAVLLTHPHADHDGGLEGLTGVVEVERVIIPAATAEEFKGMQESARALTGRGPVLARAGDRLRVGEWTLTILWPPELIGDTNTNDTSLIVEARLGSFSAILTGDAEAAPQDALVAQGTLRRCDALKVPHHGSAAGVTDRALGIWRPALALVSVGEGNDFGHPVPSTLQQLTAAGARTLRTDHSGDITIRVKDGTFRVEGERTRVRQ